MFPTPQPIVPSLQARVHPDEWQARLELAACYRVFAMLGWTEMIYNHITLRLPDSVTGDEKHFLIRARPQASSRPTGHWLLTT